MSTLPLVLLHGWGLSARVWAGLRAALPEELAVHAPELPGHGEAPPAAAATLEAWGEQLLAAMPARAVLCGWSLGGLIALDLALRHPQRIARVVLTGASPCFVARAADDAHGAWPHGLAPTTVDEFIAGFATDAPATLRRFVALQALGDGQRRTVATALAKALSGCDGTRRAALADGLELLARADLRPALPRLHVPVESMHGAHDALMPVDGARWLARQWPQSRLTVFDDCGHAPFLSHPAACAAIIARNVADA